MHERPLVLLTAGFLLGILGMATEAVLVLPVAAFVGMLLIYKIKVDKRKAFAVFRLCLYCIGFLAGAWNYRQEQEFRAEYADRLSDGEIIIVQGELDEKELKNNKYLYYLKNCYLVLSNDLVPCNQIILETAQDVSEIGKILVVEGEISAFHTARNEGNFDEFSFYQSQKIDLKITNIIVKKQFGEADSFREKLFLLRQQIRNVYETCMTEETAGILATMVLSEKSLMNQEVKMLYQKVGISHILAISGLHISIIGMTLYKLLRKLTGSYWLSGLAAGSFMIAYGAMTGYRPSSTRAIVMFLMILVARAVGRTYDSLSALALAAFLLLWENPFLLNYAGFLFSFAAVLGVVLVSNIILKTFRDEKAHKTLKAFYTSFSIQLMTLPLTAYFYYEIPVYGMVVNLLVLPLVGTLLSVGIVGGVLGLASLEVAKWVLMPCQWILVFYQELSAFVQKLPQAALITGQPENEKMLCYYVVLFGILFLISKRKKQRFFGAVGICLLIYVLTPSKNSFKLAVLDVGQGDGIYLRTESGQHLFFDGGSSDVSQVGTYRILPFLKANGVREIDYWFVSHADKDHISGLEELLEYGYPIETLIFSERIIKDDAYEELLALAATNQTEVVWMGYQDVLHLGEETLTCVFPTDDFISEDKNAASFVLYYEQNIFSALFTGDIGENEEELLVNGLDTWSVDKDGLDFYKVAHHGSRYSNSEALLEALKPEVAVISCGVNNWYGHPHIETLDRLQEAGCNVWNTANCGQITIIVDEKARNGVEITVYGLLKSD